MHWLSQLQSHSSLVSNNHHFIVDLLQSISLTFQNLVIKHPKNMSFPQISAAETSYTTFAAAGDCPTSSSDQQPCRRVETRRRRPKSWSGHCSLQPCLLCGICWIYTSTYSINRSLFFFLSCFLLQFITMEVGNYTDFLRFLNLTLKVLKAYHFPATLTAFQFGCGTVIILLMWGLNLYPKPKINRSQVISYRIIL